MIGTHLSRLAEDLIIYGSSEFGFVRFGDAYYVRLEHDAAEAQPRRARAGARVGRANARRISTTLLATLKGLPSSYNKDLQDDKRVLFDAVDTLLLVLPAVAGALAECEFDTAADARGALEHDDGDGPRGLSRSEGRDFPRGTRCGRTTDSPV